MENNPQSKPYYLEPYSGESISHYFGRFRRQETVHISAPSRLSQEAGVGPVLARWEKFRFIPFPSQEELMAIGLLIGLSVEQLEAMLPPSSERMKIDPIRLCGACYADAPYHRLEWQFQSTTSCERHKLRLLSTCPACGEPFSIPSEWVVGKCKKCGMPFKSMTKRQKPVQANE